MSTKYPIAEVFDSVQGEGTWTGTPMTFVRLAGCNVGRYRHSNSVTGGSKYAECETFDGFKFTCDTDYHKSSELDAGEIVKIGQPPRICLTGGEPFLHDLSPIASHATANGRTLHIETSGTKPITGFRVDYHWITCCPKRDFLEENLPYPNEWKFLIESESQLINIENFLSADDQRPVFLQPINGINTVSLENTRLCQRMLEYHPNWRLSVQLHKFLGVR